MICPVCGGDELLSERLHLFPYEWFGHETMLEAYGELCPVCGEMVLAKGSPDLLEAQSRAFRKKVREEIPLPEDVASMRERLALTPEKADELFGLEDGSFARYAHGEEKVPFVVFQLLWLLGKYPHLIGELRGGE